MTRSVCVPVNFLITKAPYIEFNKLLFLLALSLKF